MEIRLKPEHEAIVAADVESGRSASPDEHIAEAIDLLKERQQWRSETLEEENDRLEISIAEADRGELLDEEEVRRRMRAMKTEWATRRSA